MSFRGGLIMPNCVPRIKYFLQQDVTILCIRKRQHADF